MTTFNFAGFTLSTKAFNQVVEEAYDHLLSLRKFHGESINYSYVDSDGAYAIHVVSHVLVDGLNEQQAEEMFEAITDHLYDLFEERETLITSTQDKALAILEDALDRLSYEAELDPFFNEFLARLNSEHNVFSRSVDDLYHAIKHVRGQGGV